jgi:hypothetical protein
MDDVIQELELAIKYKKSRFVGKYITSCEAHIKSAFSLWRNIKYIQSHSKKLFKNLEALQETVNAASSSAFKGNVEKDLSQANNEVAQLRQMLASRSYSHFVANEHMCGAAKRVNSIHSRAVEYSKEVSIARDAKSVALTRMEKQEDSYSKACGELDKLLRKLDEALALVTLLLLFDLPCTIFIF